jgi:hypothetical protein
VSIRLSLITSEVCQVSHPVADCSYLHDLKSLTCHTDLSVVSASADESQHLPYFSLVSLFSLLDRSKL